MILYDERRKLFRIETEHTTYAMQVTESGRLVHLYWGEKVRIPEDLPSVGEETHKYGMGSLPETWRMEYPGWGEGQFNLHAVKATYADGTRNLMLRYVSHSVEGETLRIILRDEPGLEAELIYQTRPELDIIDRHTVFTNTGNGPVRLENAASALWRFPETGTYRLTKLTGDWAKEFQVRRQEVQQGVTLLETRSNLSGPACAPLFMLDDGHTTELAGAVYFGRLPATKVHSVVVPEETASYFFTTRRTMAALPQQQYCAAVISQPFSGTAIHSIGPVALVPVIPEPPRSTGTSAATIFSVSGLE